MERKILTWTFSAFQSSLLSVYVTSKGDNIGIFSNFAAKMYINTPLLCNTFWNN